MWKTQPQCSEMSSCSEAAKPTHPTNLMPGKHLLYKLVIYVHRYPCLPNLLHSGFNAGVPVIHTTSTPSNSPSITEHTPAFNLILQKESSAVATLAHSHKLRLKKPLAPFSHRPWPSSLNLIASMHTGCFRISHFHIPPQLLTI